MGSPRCYRENAGNGLEPGTREATQRFAKRGSAGTGPHKALYPGTQGGECTARTRAMSAETWTRPGVPLLSIRDAVFT